MVKWEELCFILTVLLLLGWYIYYLCSQQGTYLRHLKIVTDNITILFVKIKSFTEKAIIGFKRKMAEYLNVVYKLAMLVSAKFLIGDADIWKVCWIAGIATFALLCYFMKLCVERKRDELTPTSQNVTLRINERVWFSTLTRVLEVLLPLSYLALAFAYYMELGPNNHPAENNWKTFASAMKICILVLTVLIPVMDIYHICNTTDELDVQPAAVVQRDVKNQSIDANAAKGIHIDVDLYVADADIQKVAVHMDDVDRQSISADQAGVAIQIDDVGNQSYANGNEFEVALHMDAENLSAS